MLGGGTGPTAGTNATAPARGISRMIQAADAFPVNLGCRRATLAARCAGGNGQGRCLRSNCRGLGDDARRNRLLPVVAEDYDVQVMIHTDTLNESGLSGHHQGIEAAPSLRSTEGARRPRAGHHQGGGLRTPPSSTNRRGRSPQHHRRASRYADGVPPPRSVDRGGPGVRREPYPQGNHCGGRYPHDIGALS